MRIRLAASTAALALAAATIMSARTPAGATAKDVTVLGFRLHYLEAGQGPPVVLLHGLGGDGSRWAPNIGPLARDFHVRLEQAIAGSKKILIDNCGHLPQLECADQFNRIVHEFLQGRTSSQE